MLQYYYQQGMLYRLRAMGHSKQMDVTGGLCVSINKLKYLNFLLIIQKAQEYIFFVYIKVSF